MRTETLTCMRSSAFILNKWFQFLIFKWKNICWPLFLFLFCHWLCFSCICWVSHLDISSLCRKVHHASREVLKTALNSHFCYSGNMLKIYSFVCDMEFCWKSVKFCARRMIPDPLFCGLEGWSLTVMRPSTWDRSWCYGFEPCVWLSLKADSHVACSTHAVPLPSHAINSHIPYLSHAVPLLSHAVNSHMPCCSHAVPLPSHAVNSHIPCRSHAIPLPCCAVNSHTCPAAPLPCSDSAVSFVKVRVVAGNIRTASPVV